MLVPAGRDGPEFIVTPNFYIIKNSNSDLSWPRVWRLADRIASGSGSFQGAVGRCRQDAALGCRRHAAHTGTTGLRCRRFGWTCRGYKTRRAIGQWQVKNGEKPTCFPEASMKGKLE